MRMLQGASSIPRLPNTLPSAWECAESINVAMPITVDPISFRLFIIPFSIFRYESSLTKLLRAMSQEMCKQYETRYL